MKTLKQNLKEKKFAKSYLFYGKEGYLRDAYLQRVKKELIPGEAEMMNVTIFEGKKVESGTIIAMADTFPFLSEKRLVIVRDSGLFQAGRKDETEKMANYLGNVPESTCLLFVETEIDKRNKLYKAVVKVGQVVDFSPLTERELLLWITKECKKENIAIDGSVGSYFLRSVGGEMEYIYGELQKLMMFKGQGGVLSREDIDAICSKSLEMRIFDLVAALGNQKPREALLIYRHLLLMKESPIGILVMLVRQFRLILQCKLLLEQGTPQSAIGEKVGIRDFVVRECVKQGKNFSIPKLKNAMEECLQTDVDIKTGKMVGDLAVELLILKYGKA